MLDHDLNINFDNDNECRKELTSDEKLTILFDYASKIADENRLDYLLQLMADLGRELVVADRCTIWIHDKENQELWTKVAHGVKEIRIPENTGVVGHVVKTQEKYITNDAYHDANFNGEVDKKTGYRTKALLALPLYDNEGVVFGAYQAVNKMTEAHEFSEEDVNYLKMVASYSEKSLSNAMLNEEIEKSQKEFIFLMAEIGESRSKETGNHVKRVAEISALLARLYGLKEEEVELIKMASPMHDIGKVAMPDEILKKPSKLTLEEFNIIKEHATVGYNLLKNSKRKIIKTSAIIAKEHHERWNGTGYPDGLKGEEIHLYGRISAIADVFDALANYRVYKSPWEYEKIIHYFQKEQGQHFDPELTQIFLDNFQQFAKIIETNRDPAEGTLPSVASYPQERSLGGKNG